MTSQRAPNRTPPEQVTIITGGVNVRIEGLDQRIGGKPIGMVELSADRMVIWSRSDIATGASEGVVQAQDEPFEIYMEGNIIIRQGDPNNGQLMRECKAETATFDARDNKALLLNAELKTYLPSIQGTIRVWAERLRQLGPNTFHGTHVWSTTSPYGKPGVRVQSTDVFLEERERQQSSIFGPDANEPQQVNPATGEPDPQTQNWITSLNNVFFIEDVPVFYLPYIGAPADKSEIPLQSILFSQDSIFGTTIRTMWDPFKLFGFMDPKGAQWSLLGDYFSRRGPAVGMLGKYKGDNLFGIPGKYFGEMNSLYVHDVGTDDLGADRQSVTPSTQNRGIFEMRHEQQLPNGFTFIAEAGWQSDRNFQDQYFQSEFDRGKDIESLVYLKQQQSNWAWTAIIKPNDQPFEYETQWLPRGDLYVLSQPLFNGLMTYSQHTSGAYAEVHQGDPPSSQEVFTPISYFAHVHGADLFTRQQVDAPFNLGPVNVVPHAMGEAAYWGDSFDGEPVSRLAANLGLKSSVEMWRAFPEVQSDIFNLNGLAHKIVFETDYEYTTVNRSMSDIAQWNELDDNAQERFQERLVQNTFGGVLPLPFDHRLYALRTGAGLSVTSPDNELLDDQQFLTLAVHQRLQTKVGPPDRQRIRDWMTLDLSATYFPDAARDDFGASWGLLTARYAWNISQRTTILANAQYDTFTGAEQLWNVAMLSQRSERGSVYVGLAQVKGDSGVLDSDILTLSYSYQMSTKWISTIGTAYDFAEHRNVGQSFTISRIGLDFIINVAGSYDVSTGNTSFAVSIEPRIGNFGNSMTQLSNLLAGRQH